MTLVDASKGFDLYTRPIWIREDDGSYRTANYNERRKVEDENRYIRKPNIVFPEYFWPNEEEMEQVSVKHRSPRGFQLMYDYEGDVSMAIRGEWEKKVAEEEWKDPHNFDKYNIFSKTTDEPAQHLSKEKAQKAKTAEKSKGKASMDHSDITDEELTELFKVVGETVREGQVQQS